MGRLLLILAPWGECCFRGGTMRFRRAFSLARRNVWCGGVALCWLLWPAVALGLDPSRTVFQYGCENWSRRNGLPASGIKAITQSADGYLWLGTQQGLVRFDGIGFTQFQVDPHPMFVSQNISSLARSREGGVWFGLKEGAVGYFDGRTFSPLGAPWVEPNMQVLALTEARDGSLWVGWNFGYGRWTKERAVPTASEQSIGFVPYQVVHEDPLGRVWLGTGDTGQLYYWQAGERHRFPDETLAQSFFFAVAVDARGDIWVGTQHGLRCYDAEFRRKELPALSTTAQVNALLIDRYGVLWVGTEGNGLWRWKDGAFAEFRKSNGLVDDYVTALYEDVEGSVWVGTRGGLSQLTDVKFPIDSTAEGLLGESLGVAPAASGGAWVATTRGINRIGAGEPFGFGTESGLENNYIKRVWEAADGDVYFFDGDRGVGVIADGKIVALHKMREWPVAITEDERGVIVSVAGTLYRASREALTPWEYAVAEPPALVWAVNLWPARDGSLWVAGHRGVWRIDPDGTYRQWTPQNGLSGLVANWVFEDVDGAVWVGLATGIARFKNGVVRNINRADGLFANFIHAIVPDQFGWFWFDSSDGVFRAHRDALNALADGKASRVECEPFDGQHAIKTTDKGRQEATAARTRDGRICFPTAQGVVWIDPANVPMNRVPPPVYIQRIRVNGREVLEKKLPSAPAGRGELEFHYAALSFIASQNIRFRYRLEGYDEHWVDAGDRRSAFYTNLRPGNYIYRVQASNADGVWSPEGDSVGIALRPEFYQTGWFTALCAFAGVGILFGLYGWRTRTLRVRERSLQESNELLEARVQERTAELAAANQSLTEEIAERRRFEEEAEKSSRQLILASRQAGMAEVATSVLHNVGNVLNSVNVSTAMIAERLRQSRASQLPLLAELLAANAGNPQFLVDDEKGKQVPEYLRRLAQHLAAEQTALGEEVDSLQKNVDHIKEIVRMQQDFSKMAGLIEPVHISEIVEDAIRLNSGVATRVDVKIGREIVEDVQLVVEKNKVLQILVNLINNALRACDDTTGRPPEITIRAQRHERNMVRVEVTDNGVGIPVGNLTRIFTQGFTTKRDGHGYGLHNSANAAQAMGGRLFASSAGADKGATFTLDLPVRMDVAAAEAVDGARA